MSNITETPATTDARPKADRRLRLLAVAAAIALPVLIWVLAVPVFDADLRVTDDRVDPPKVQEIGLGAILFIATVSSLLGWASLAVLERFTRHAAKIWAGVAVLVLALSYLPLLGTMTSGARFTFAVLHLAVGLVLIPNLYRSSPPRP